jgi:hypothetical protein
VRIYNPNHYDLKFSENSFLDKIRKLDAHNGFVKGLTWDPVGKFLATQVFFLFITEF